MTETWRRRVDLIVGGLAGAALILVSAELVGQAPPSQAPPLPMAVADTAKAPAVPEVMALKIQNAGLRANIALAQLQATPAWAAYQKQIASAEAIIKAEVAAFEAAEPGWTLDTVKLVAVKKPAEKGK